MASLEELRAELDTIDDQLVRLYEKRMEVCEAVGEYKVHTGRKVYDRQRENEKLTDVASKVEGEFNKKGVRELYRQLMSMSRKLQYRQLVEAGALGRLPFIQVDSLDAENARVVYQGTEGAYSQAAMEQYFGKNVNSFHVRTFREAMEAIEEGSARDPQIMRSCPSRIPLRARSMRCMTFWMNLKTISWRRQYSRSCIHLQAFPGRQFPISVQSILRRRP